MDQNNYNPYSHNPYESHRPSYQTKPVNRFERSAIICGVAAILTSSFFYVSFICGGLAILFATLSRGGKMSYSTNSKIAIFLGIMGFVLTIFIYAIAFFILFQEFGSLEGILKGLSELSGYDYEALFNDLMN